MHGFANFKFLHFLYNFMYIHNITPLQNLAAMFQIYFSWVVQVIWKARYKFQAPVFFVWIPWNDLNKIFTILGGRSTVYRHIHYFIQELSVATSSLLSISSSTLDRPPTRAVKYRGVVTKAIFQIKEGPEIPKATMLVFMLSRFLVVCHDMLRTKLYKCRPVLCKNKKDCTAQ